MLPTPGDLVPGKWHELEMTWECENHEALVRLDGEEIARLHQFVSAPGACYLRLRSVASETDSAGLYVRRVDVAVEP